jgi:hypothetical protein
VKRLFGDFRHRRFDGNRNHVGFIGGRDFECVELAAQHARFHEGVGARFPQPGTPMTMIRIK